MSVAATLKILVDANTKDAQAKIAQFNKQMDETRARTKDKVSAQLGADLDTKAFKAYDAQLAKVQRQAADKARFKVALGADFNSAGFRAYQREVDKVERQKKITTEVRAQTTVAVERLRQLQVRIGQVPDKVDFKVDADTGVARAQLDLLQRKIHETERIAAEASLGGGGKGGGGIGSALASSFSGGIGGAGTVAKFGALLPLITAATGGLTALAGSAGAATLGVGALATSGLGALAAGLGPIVALSGGMKDAIKLSGQLEKAQKNVASAQQQYGGQNKGLTTAQNNYNAAVAAFGPQSKAAVAAHNQLALAQQKQATTAPQIVSAQNALNKLMLQANPAVLAFAKSWGEVDDALKKAEQNVLPAIATALKPVLDTFVSLLPTLEKMAKIDLRGLSAGFAPLLAFFHSGTFKAQLVALSEVFAKIAGPLGQAFTNLFRVFLNVAIAASPYLIQIAKAFERWAKSFADAHAPGKRLNDLIHGFVSQTHSWWKLIEAVGRLLVTVFKGGAADGKHLVDQLTTLVNKWTAWLGSTAGQAAMKKFFTESLKALQAIAKALGSIAPLIAALGVGLLPALTTLLTPLAKLLRDISEFVNGLSSHLPPVISALPGLAVAVGVLASWQALKVVVGQVAARILGIGAAEATVGVGAAGAGAAGAAAGGGLLGALGRLGPRAAAGIEAGGLAAGGALEGLGAGAAGAGVVAAAGTIAPIVAATLPILLAGGAAVLIGKFMASVFNKPVVLPKGASSQDVTKALQQRGGGFAANDINNQLRQKGAFSGAGNASQATNDILKANAAIVKLTSHRASIAQTAMALDRLSVEAKKAGDVKWSFADHLGAEMLRGRGVASRGVQNVIRSLNTLAPGARAAAAQAMTQMTQRLEAGGLVARGTTVKLVASLLGHYKETRDKGGVYFRGLVDTTGALMDQLRTKIATSTGKQRTDALNEYHELHRGAIKRFDLMNSDLGVRLDALHDGIVNKSHDAVTKASKSLYNFAFNVQWAMQSGVLSAGDGSAQMAKLLDHTISAFGGKVIPAVVAVEKTSTGAAVQALLGKIKFSAGGGYIGSPGETGRDEVPIVVGRGEAVLNHSQQKVVNSALTAQGIGGLPEVFSRVRRPHYMAMGGYASGGQVNAATNPATTGGSAPGYVYPLSGFTLGRTDMGVDANAAPGTPIGPIGRSRIGGIQGNWFRGQPYINWQLLDGPAAGRWVYVAEQITNLAQPGSILQPNQAVARYAGSGTGIEMGWSLPGAGANALASGHYSEGQVTAEGSSFRSFIGGLSHGLIQGLAGALGALGAAPAAVWKNIAVPGVKGTGTIAEIVRAALKKETDAANAFGQKQVGALGGTSGTGGSTAGLSGNTMQIVQQLAGRYGWANQVGDWQYVLNRESNGTLTDTNPSSGAYGLAQFINGPGDYYKYGGNPNTYQGQLLAMANYIKQRYGNPAAAAAHERAFNWYSQGGIVPSFATGGAVAKYAQGGNVWRVPYSDEDASSGSGWTELSTNGNAAAKSGHPHTATHSGGWDFATLGRMYPKGTQLRIQAMSGRVGTFPLTDYGDGSSFAPAIGLTPAVRSYLNPGGGVVDISLPNGNINLASGFGSLVSGGSSSATGGSTSKAAPKPKPIVVPSVAIPWEKAGRLINQGKDPGKMAWERDKKGHKYPNEGTGKHKGFHHVFKPATEWVKDKKGHHYKTEGKGRHKGYHSAIKHWKPPKGAEKLDAAFKIIPDPQAFLDGVKDPFTDWSTALDNQFSLIGTILGEQDAAGNPHSTLFGDNGPPSDIALVNPKPGNLTKIGGIKWPTYGAGTNTYDAEAINRLTAIGVLGGKAHSETEAVTLLGKAIKDRKDREKGIEKFLKLQLKHRNTLQAHKDKIAAEQKALVGKDLRARLNAAVSTTAAGARISDANTRISDASDTITSLQALRKAENARGPAANLSLIAGYDAKIAAKHAYINQEHKYIKAQQKKQPTSVSSALEAIAKHNLSDESSLLGKEIAKVGDVLSEFGGSRTKIGKTGLFGNTATEITTLQTGAKTFADDIATILTSSIPDLQLQLRDFASAKTAASTAAGPDLAALNALLLTQLQQANLNTSVSEAQFRTLANYPGIGASRGGFQFAGAFAGGGTTQIPGWSLVGERGPELINAPVGSRILNANQTSAAVSKANESSQPIVLVQVLDGAVDPKYIRVISGREAEAALRRAGRGGRAPLPGAGGGR